MAKLKIENLVFGCYNEQNKKGRYMQKIVLLLLVFVAILQAEVQDKFKISFGLMHVINYETEMQIAPKDAPIGARLNTKDHLNMKNDTNVFRLSGYYRFNSEDSIDFSYFSVNSHGVTSGDVTWDGNEIASASLHSYFNMDIYKVNYNYSFYHNDKVELALAVGLHVTSVDLGIDAYGVVNGHPGEYYNSATKLTLPLPVVGFKGEYRINKELFVEYKTDYLYLEFDGYKGALLTSTFNLEYRFIEDFGVGVGYNVNKIRVEGNGDNARVDVLNTLSGVVLFFSYIY